MTRRRVTLIIKAKSSLAADKIEGFWAKFDLGYEESLALMNSDKNWVIKLNFRHSLKTKEKRKTEISSNSSFWYKAKVRSFWTSVIKDRK